MKKSDRIPVIFEFDGSTVTSLAVIVSIEYAKTTNPDNLDQVQKTVGSSRIERGLTCCSH